MKLARQAGSSSQLVQLASSCKRGLILMYNHEIAALISLRSTLQVATVFSLGGGVHSLSAF